MAATSSQSSPFPDQSGRVLTRREGAVALVVLNRPEARNAIDAALAAALIDAIEASQDAGAIVLTGTDPAFCAGLDLRRLGAERLSDLPEFIDAPSRSAVPVIAAVNGPAVTGGLELALACDFIVASERAQFADTHLRVGVFPGPVLVELPRRVGMARAREMTLTGNFVDAPTAQRIGLANHVVPHGDLLPFAVRLAGEVAEQDPGLVRSVRHAWNVTHGLPVAEAHRARIEQTGAQQSLHSGAEQLAARREAVMERARTHPSAASRPPAAT
jgi:enoyl-CoA hydratase